MLLNGCPGNNAGYGPARWKACEKLGLYMAVGAAPAVLAMPRPFIGAAVKPVDTLKKKHGILHTLHKCHVLAQLHIYKKVKMTTNKMAEYNCK